MPVPIYFSPQQLSQTEYAEKNTEVFSRKKNQPGRLLCFFIFHSGYFLKNCCINEREPNVKTGCMERNSAAWILEQYENSLHL
ncbi:hypothetical protein BIV59_16905 [Bacillus sp. MUM 13]|nr:hypothetical protein BIV59_16905 [Bacillus sp. MUM 13]